MTNLDDLIDDLSEDAEAVKVAANPLHVSTMWMLAILLYVIMFLSMVGLREDISEVMGQPLFIFELLAIVATIIATSIAASMGAAPDRARSRLATWAPLLPLSAFIIILGMQLFQSIGMPHAHEIGKMDCAGWICMLSLLPAAGLFLLLSQGFCLNPRTSYAYAALAASMTAYLVLRLEEPYVSPMHLIVTHIIPMALLIVIAGFVARLKIFSPLLSCEK